MGPVIIGIRGAMGAGKDTLAATICEAAPQYSVRKFATALREAAGAIVDLPCDEAIGDAGKAVDLSGRVYDPSGVYRRTRLAIGRITGRPPSPGAVQKICEVLTVPDEGGLRFPMTVGRLLQLLGTECGRRLLGENVWVDALFRRWDADGRPPIVIADVRFPNESAAIRERGGVVVLVRRDGASRCDGRASGHASEHALDGEPPEYVIDNNGSLEDLRHLARLMLSKN